MNMMNNKDILQNTLIDRFLFRYFDEIKKQVVSGPFSGNTKHWARFKWFSGMNFNKLRWNYDTENLDCKIREAVYVTFSLLEASECGQPCFQSLSDWFRSALYLAINIENSITTKERYLLTIQQTDIAFQYILYQLGILEFRDEGRTTKQIKGRTNATTGADGKSISLDVTFGNVLSYINEKIRFVFPGEYKCFDKERNSIPYRPVQEIASALNRWRNTEIHNAFLREPEEYWNRIRYLLVDISTLIFFTLRGYEIEAVSDSKEAYIAREALERAQAYIQKSDLIHVDFLLPSNNICVEIEERDYDNPVGLSVPSQLPDGRTIISAELKRDFYYTLTCEHTRIDFSTTGFYNGSRIEIDLNNLDPETLRPIPKIDAIIYDPIFAVEDEHERAELYRKLSAINDKELSDKLLVILGLKEGEREKFISQLKGEVNKCSVPEEVRQIIQKANSLVLKEILASIKNNKDENLDLSEIKIDLNGIRDIAAGNNTLLRKIERYLRTSRWAVIILFAVCIVSALAVAAYMYLHSADYLYSKKKYYEAYSAGHPLGALALAKEAESANDFKAAGEWWPRAFNDVSSAFENDSTNASLRRKLADMYRYGKGTPQNYQKAINLLSALKDSTINDFGLHSYLRYKAGEMPEIISYDIEQRKAFNDSAASNPYLILTEALLNLERIKRQKQLSPYRSLRRIDSLARCGMPDAALEIVRQQLEAVKTVDGIDILPTPSSIISNLRTAAFGANIPSAWEMAGDWESMLGTGDELTCYKNAIYGGRDCNLKYVEALLQNGKVYDTESEEFLRVAEERGDTAAAVLRLFQLNKAASVDSAVYVSKLLDIPGVEKYALYVARDLIRYGDYDTTLKLFHANGRTNINRPYLEAHNAFYNKDLLSYVSNLYTSASDGCPEAYMLLGNYCSKTGKDNYAKHYYTQALEGNDSEISCMAAAFLAQYGDSILDETIQKTLKNNRNNVYSAIFSGDKSPNERIRLCARLLFGDYNDPIIKSLLAFNIGKGYDELGETESAIDWYGLTAYELNYSPALLPLLRNMIKFEDNTFIGAAARGKTTLDVFADLADYMSKAPKEEKAAADMLMIDIAHIIDDMHNNSTFVEYLKSRGMNTDIDIPEDFTYHIPVTIQGGLTEF